MPAEAKLEIVLSRKPGEQPAPRNAGIAAEAAAQGDAGTKVTPVAAKTVTDQTVAHREEFREVLNKIHQEHLEAIKALMARSELGKTTDYVPLSSQIVKQQQEERRPKPRKEADDDETQVMKVPSLKAEKPITLKKKGPEESDDVKNMLEKHNQVQQQFVQFLSNLASGKPGGILQQGGGLASAFAYRTEQDANKRIVEDGATSKASGAMLQLATRAGIAGAVLAGFGLTVNALTQNFKTRADDIRKYSAALTRNEALFAQQDIMRDINLARNDDNAAKAELFLRRFENGWKDFKDGMFKGWATIGAKVEEWLQSKENQRIREDLLKVVLELRQRGKTDKEIVEILKAIKDHFEKEALNKAAEQGTKVMDDMMAPPDFGIDANRARPPRMAVRDFADMPQPGGKVPIQQ